jgi:hypothetical protein
MKLFKTLLLAVICIAATSCSLLEEFDDIPDENNPDPNALRLTSERYYFSDKSFNQIKFIYNANSQLLRKNWYNSNNEIDFYEDFIYTQGQLSKIKRSISKGEFAEVRFTYKNGKIHTLEYWMEDADGNLKKLHSTDYEYINDQIAKSTTTFYNGSSSYFSVYTFSGGNLISLKAHDLSTNELLEEHTYAYDNKINPHYKLSHQYLGSPIASSKNNVLHYKIVSYKHIPQNPEMTYEYTYNDKGYPVEKYILGNTGKRYIEESFAYDDIL